MLRTGRNLLLPARGLASCRSGFRTSALLLAEGDEKVSDDEALVTEARRMKEAQVEDLRMIDAHDSPLSRFLRFDEVRAEHDRLKALQAEIRARYPDRAAYADKFMESMTSGTLLQELERQYPEFSQKKLTDLDVFKFFEQFVRGDLTPGLASAKKQMEKTEELKEQKRLDARRDADDRNRLIVESFPDIFRALSDATLPKRDERLSVDDKIFTTVRDQVSASVLDEALHLNSTNVDEYEAKFFEGFDKADVKSYQARKDRWQELQRYLKSREPKVYPPGTFPPVDEEPQIEGALPVDQIFHPKQIGKILRINEREKKSLLPEGFCGMLEEREFGFTQTHSLLLRSPVLDVIEKLERGRRSSFTRSSVKPFVLYGDKGVGKSAILQQVIYWARKSGWLVVNVKSGTKWVNAGGVLEKSTIIPGCWDQPYLAVKMLSYLLEAHSDQLKQIPIRTSFKIGPFQGSTLFDLVEFGASLHEYATESFVHFHNELERVIEFPVLVTFDDYNQVYNYSQGYRNPESTRFKPEKLRARDLTLTRLFYDAHTRNRYANGIFVGATNNETTLRHFDIASLKNEDWLEIQGFSVDEVGYMLHHYQRTKATFANTSRETHAILRQLTDGRGFDLWKWSQGL